MKYKIETPQDVRIIALKMLKNGYTPNTLGQLMQKVNECSKGTVSIIPKTIQELYKLGLIERKITQNEEFDNFGFRIKPEIGIYIITDLGEQYIREQIPEN